MKLTIKLQKSLLLRTFFGFAAIAMAIAFNPSNLFAGNSSRNKNLEPPNQKALEPANRCADSKKSPKCKKNDQLLFDYHYNNGKIETTYDIDLKTFTELLRQRIENDGKCTLTQVNLSRLKQRWFVGSRNESGLNDILDLLGQCQNLTHLNLEGLTLKRQDFVIIAEMSSLKYLNLRNTNLTPELFKDTIGGTETKLTKLKTLLIKPSKDRRLVRDLLYPRDFYHLPKIDFFDGSLKDAIGTLVQLDNLGSTLSQTYRGFRQLPPDLASVFKNESKNPTMRKALTTLGREILQATSEEDSEDAARLLQEPIDWGSTPDPDARTYERIGQLLINSYPDVAHFAFEKAMNLSKAQDIGARYSNVEQGSYKERYNYSIFRHGLALYKTSVLRAKSPAELEKKRAEAIERIEQAKKHNNLDAEHWLTHFNEREKELKQDRKAGLDKAKFTFNTMKASESAKDLDSVFTYIKRAYIDPDFGCDLQSVDLTDINSRSGRKVKFVDLLSLLRHECKGLQELTLGNTRLSDQDVREIRQMDQLRTLRFNGISVSSGQLKEIGQMDRLEKLVLAFPNNKRNQTNETAFKKHILTMRGLKDLEVVNVLRPGTIAPTDLGQIRLRESSVSR